MPEFTWGALCDCRPRRPREKPMGAVKRQAAMLLSWRCETSCQARWSLLDVLPASEPFPPLKGMFKDLAGQVACNCDVLERGWHSVKPKLISAS